MSALPSVERLDVFEDVPFGFVSASIEPMIDELPLERLEETFDVRVVPTVALATYASP